MRFIKVNVSVKFLKMKTIISYLHTLNQDGQRKPQQTHSDYSTRWFQYYLYNKYYYTDNFNIRIGN
jgi:hypothetical protein